MKQYAVTDLITEMDIKRLDLSKHQSLLMEHDGKKYRLTLDVAFDISKAGFLVKAGLMIEDAEKKEDTDE